VTTHVRDAITLVHGPKGCTHHNFSLLHATGLDNDTVILPDIISTSLSESDIIFGGEETLLRALESVSLQDVRAIFVLSTCIVETIGDDVGAVCGRDFGVPVIPIPTAGFLGGTFQNGVNNALIAIAATAKDCTQKTGVNIIGEKNLEYEVEENYTEVERILSALGIPVTIRFVHDLPFERISHLGSARLNILRDASLVPVGEYLFRRFGTPFISSFPLGLSDTISFIGSVARACGVDGCSVVDEELVLQRDIIAGFADLKGSLATFDTHRADPEGTQAVFEAAQMVRLKIGKDGSGTRLPIHPAVGTSGVKRMLHRWRRAIHA
jgi:nitrogenase molybdenum-iron protein alpha/beta subunit